MAVLGMVVVARSVEVRRHDAPVISSVLPVITFAELDSCDFSDGIGFVGWFKRSGEQCIFTDWLRRHLRIDAARSEEKQFLHSCPPGFVNHIRLDHHVPVDELGRIGVVGVNTPDFRCCEIDLVRSFRFEECPYGRLVG